MMVDESNVPHGFCISKLKEPNAALIYADLIEDNSEIIAEKVRTFIEDIIESGERLG